MNNSFNPIIPDNLEELEYKQGQELRERNKLRASLGLAKYDVASRPEGMSFMEYEFKCCLEEAYLTGTKTKLYD